MNAPSFDLQPILTGKLVELRPLQRSDFDRLYAVASDPLIWEQHPASDRWQEPVFRDFFEGAMASGGAFLVLDKATGEPIGSTRFANYSPERSEVEIGWTFLARRCWGGAYNGEMKRLMLSYAFGFVGSVLFLVGPQNMRSQKAVGKIGGAREGSIVREGRDSVVFRIRAEDWARARGGEQP